MAALPSMDYAVEALLQLASADLSMQEGDTALHEPFDASADHP